MKNFIRGSVLGAVVGVALFWYGGMMDYFPAIVATIILTGVLIPLESQERRLVLLLGMVEEIQRRLEQQQYPPRLPPQQEDWGGVPPPAPRASVPQPEEEPAFIPALPSETASSTPTRQRKRTVDRSVGDVAKKLSSMQGG